MYMVAICTVVRFLFPHAAYLYCTSLPLQLVHECRDTLVEAIKVRKKYREVMEVVTCANHSMEQVEGDMEFFENDLNKVLMVRRGLINCRILILKRGLSSSTIVIVSPLTPFLPPSLPLSSLLPPRSTSTTCRSGCWCPVAIFWRKSGDMLRRSAPTSDQGRPRRVAGSGQ